LGADGTPSAANEIWGGLSGAMLNPDADWASLSWSFIPLDAKFFFQLVFAATTATIVSGAMAERTKFTTYMMYSAVVSAVIYPISGHWIWGGGWLATKWNFFDFAGSTVVHSCGGWLSLIGAFILGPRLGKYGPDGKSKAIPGHNLVFVCLGVFILWLGWFGFNPGSTMSADASLIAKVTINTNAAAALGCVVAMLTARLLFGKWEATMAMNGALAGLVAVTCPCAWITIPSAFVIGAVAGVLVVLSVLFVENTLKIDDPVGAISVHGLCGAWGTLSLGLFSTGTGELSPFPGLFNGGGTTQLMGQAVGVGAVFLWAIACGGILFTILKMTVGLRVTAEEEREGLDIGEHGNEAYHGFQFVTDHVN
jgi:ammonium transporter, Amt family